MDKALADIVERLGQTGDGMLAIDREFRVIGSNDAAADLLRLRSTEVVGCACYEVLRALDRYGNPVCFRGCAPMTVCACGGRIRAFDCCLTGPRPAKRWVNMSTISLVDESGRLAALVHLLRPAALPAAALPPALPAGAPAPLTRREAEVWGLLLEGPTTAELAARLSVTNKTAANYVYRLLKKLGVHSRLQAVARARTATGGPTA